MDKQDWKPVVLRKTTSNQPKTLNKVPITAVNSNKDFRGTGKKITDDDGEIQKVPTVGIAIGKQIAQARIAKKLSQKQLSTQINLLLQVVQQNENGKAVRNNALLSHFEKTLGTKFIR